MRFCGSFVLLICLFVILCSAFDCVEGRRWRQIVDAASLAKTIIVDKMGGGDFTTVQSAIDSVPSGNTQWIRILIRPNTYREQVKIAPDKPFIMLEGDSVKESIISWDGSDDIVKSATFSALADNFIAKAINFENSYNYGNKANALKPAVAAFISGDKSSFYNCGFYGVQDTIWDSAGRHFFQNCRIEGAVDFIFGAGQSIYEGCNLVFLGRDIVGPGYLTAQGRSSLNDQSGFVFKSCNLVGSGRAFLGRAWRAYSRVLFYNCNLANIVEPLGWFAWDYQNSVGTITYAENGCLGAGSDKSKRVPWERTLSNSDLNQLTSPSYINRDGWLEQQPQ